MRNHYLGIIILGILVAITCVVGFIIVGSTIPQKFIDFDIKRVNDLFTISVVVENYHTDNKQLPKSLSDAAYDLNEIKDPETKKNYKYERISDTEYKLCTTFSADSEDVKRQSKSGTDLGYYRDLKDSYGHKKGYDCIKFKVTKNIIDSAAQSPSPTPKPMLFKFLAPSSKSNLCLGQEYKVEWEADPRIEEVVAQYLKAAGTNDIYFIRESIIPRGAKKDSKWLGSRSWLVGNAFTIGQNPSPAQIKPGKYTFEFSINEYGNSQYGKVQQSITSDEFTISDCSLTKTP